MLSPHQPVIVDQPTESRARSQALVMSGVHHRSRCTSTAEAPQTDKLLAHKAGMTARVRLQLRPPLQAPRYPVG
jgi:hypothetical protein